MPKRKDLLTAALKALLAGLETSALIKIPAVFISELASLPNDKQKQLASLPQEQFNELLTQSELATDNAAIAAVGAEQIKLLISNLTELSADKLDALKELTQTQYKDILTELGKISVNTEITVINTEEIKILVKKLPEEIIKILNKHPHKQDMLLIHNLPYPSIGNLFKGREAELANLRNELGDKPTAITQTIQGLGGIGKTRLAVEFGWWAVQKKKYRVVLFVSAETVELMEADLAALAGKKVLELAGEDVRQKDALDAVERWLRENGDWLLIFDNADTEEMAQKVEELLPALANGHIIITSRYKSWSGAVKPCTLKLLSPADAKEFILERTKNRRIEDNKKDEKTAAVLAEELGYLPLALEQAAAYIACKQISLADYLEQWQNEKQDVLKWHDERLMKYPASVAVTWQRTFEQLSPTARAILRLVAFLAPEAVPTEIFEKAEKNVARAADIISRQLGETQGTKCDVKKAIGELSAYSMITRKPGTFTIHRIVQETTLLKMNEKEQIQFCEIILDIITDSVPGISPDNVQSWDYWKSMDAHIATAIGYSNSISVPHPPTQLMNNLGLFYYAQARYAETKPLYRCALQIDEKALGKEHTKVATDLNNLATLLKATNRMNEAEPLMKKALQIDENALGKEHPTVARDLNNLAQLLKDTNRLTEAEPLMKRALKIDENAFGKEHPTVARDLNNLAQLLKATNRMKEAEPLMKRALKIDEKALGKDHPTVARDLNNLAGLLYATNRLAEAEPLMKRHLVIFLQFTRRTGHPHPHLKDAINNYAVLLKQIGHSDNEIKDRLKHLAPEIFEPKDKQTK